MHGMGQDTVKKKEKNNDIKTWLTKLPIVEKGCKTKDIKYAFRQEYTRWYVEVIFTRLP